MLCFVNFDSQQPATNSVLKVTLHQLFSHSGSQLTTQNYLQYTKQKQNMIHLAVQSSWKPQLGATAHAGGPHCFKLVPNRFIDPSGLSLPLCVSLMSMTPLLDLCHTQLTMWWAALFPHQGWVPWMMGQHRHGSHVLNDLDAWHCWLC